MLGAALTNGRVPRTKSNSQMMAELEVGDQRREMWRLCLLGVVALLCGEVWMTRSLVRGRS